MNSYTHDQGANSEFRRRAAPTASKASAVGSEVVTVGQSEPKASTTSIHEPWDFDHYGTRAYGAPETYRSALLDFGDRKNNALTALDTKTPKLPSILAREASPVDNDDLLKEGNSTGEELGPEIGTVETARDERWTEDAVDDTTTASDPDRLFDPQQAHAQITIQDPNIVPIQHARQASLQYDPLLEQEQLLLCSDDVPGNNVSRDEVGDDSNNPNEGYPSLLPFEGGSHLSLCDNSSDDTMRSQWILNMRYILQPLRMRSQIPVPVLAQEVGAPYPSPASHISRSLPQSSIEMQSIHSIPGVNAYEADIRNGSISAQQSSPRVLRFCHLLIVAAALIVFGSLILAIWYSTVRHNLSAGFTMAQYILGAGTLAVGCVTAIHSKYCTCWR